jgi:hypothetical protein
LADHRWHELGEWAGVRSTDLCASAYLHRAVTHERLTLVDPFLRAVFLNAMVNGICHMIGYRNFDNMATNLR